MEETYYNVNQIASMLGVHVETIRRYIRDGSLKAEITCRRHGYIVSETDLKHFMSNKYNVCKVSLINDNSFSFLTLLANIDDQIEFYEKSLEELKSIRSSLVASITSYDKEENKIT